MAASLLVGGAQATTTKPALRIVTGTPLKLAGSHFRARERIRVSGIVAGTKLGRSVTASLTGTFTVSFPAVSWDTCFGPTYVTASGSMGSRAVLKAPPRLSACIDLTP